MYLFIKTSSLGDMMHHMPAPGEARTDGRDARFF
jgi:ADP-heptose:LPS heptosyltransferase